MVFETLTQKLKSISEIKDSEDSQTKNVYLIEGIISNDFENLEYDLELFLNSYQKITINKELQMLDQLEEDNLVADYMEGFCQCWCENREKHAF